MAKKIARGRLEQALERLKGCCNSVFVDFLILKYHGLGPGAPIVITTRSTLDGCQSLMGIVRSDGAPPSREHHFFNPIKLEWRHEGYPRSGTYTTLDRSKTFSKVAETEPAGEGLQVSLRDDYIDAAKVAFRKNKNTPMAVPLSDLAAWAMRCEPFDDAATIDDVVDRFKDRYHLTDEEVAGLFGPVQPGDLPFDGAPPVPDEFVQYLLDAYAKAAAEADAAAEATERAAEELPEDLLAFLRGKLVVSDVILRQIVTLVRMGKNIILTGPPGTGKSTLAVNLARAAQERADVFDLPKTQGWMLTTATADWSTFDTIGGYMPKEVGSGLEFAEGMFLRAIREDKWLIVDELNRADADKAFGQLFTVLAKQDVELPFKRDTKPVSIRFDGNVETSGFDPAEAAYKIGQDWRVIATMNTFDRNSLFQLSLAFVRRFAVLHVDVPDRVSLKDWIEEQGLSPANATAMKRLIDLTSEHRPIGPAILGDIAEYLNTRIVAPPVAAAADPAVEAEGGEGEDAVEAAEALVPAVPATLEDPFHEAVVAYVLPQLDGLDTETLRRMRDGLMELVSPDSRSDLRRLFRELFMV